MKRHLFFPKRLLVIAVILGSLFCLPATSYSVPFISEDTELSIGKKADKEIIAQYGIYQDKPLQLYVNKVGQRLVSKLSDKIFPRFYFRVVDGPEINAFALPGGYIYVTRGLLAAVNSEAELAGVLGHEIGHVIFHHGAKAMIRAIGASILSIGGAIANPKHAGEWIAVSSAMFGTINLGYGREAELESDAQGIMNSANSGYDPKGMVDFLRGLRKTEVMSGQAYHSFQSTHPDTRDRIVKAGTMSDSIKNRGGEFSDNREVYISKLQGLVYGGKRHAKDAKRYEPEYIDIYQVKPGDTFQSIAETELDDPRSDLEIAVLNGRRESSQPVPGELLKLIKKGTYKKAKTLRLKPDPEAP